MLIASTSPSWRSPFTVTVWLAVSTWRTALRAVTCPDVTVTEVLKEENPTYETVTL